ncbi:flagellar biosynthetic protein FliO [Paenibacillus sp. HN-1]|uniref:flagellar biosynthetic protein FliO n=1 Tax=Paenibacillus TaxID=44249 RepID=UPI001CA87A41|nr:MULTISPECIES: flagellar biosynthetic protein FliO [Paenibacillus]MBY9081896.1 flagellar biosynthetic protein FliO [Paenibacillus sp. CGMCC 1.18879]MBY9085946.1 flagellar biosynthetic protein FliO [Paenibacillus sinensis]
MPSNSGFDGGSTALNLINVILVLIVILVIIVLLIRFLGRRNQSWMSNRSIRTLGAVGLGPSKSLQVIEIGESLYIIGVGENVTMLDKITDPEEAAVIMAAFEEQSTSAGSLIKTVGDKLKGKFQGKVSSEEINLNDNTSFYEMLQSKLRSAPDRKKELEELLDEDDKKNRQEET